MGREQRKIVEKFTIFLFLFAKNIAENALQVAFSHFIIHNFEQL